MPTDLENLKTRRAAICTELAALTSSAAGGRPNINGGGAGVVDHVGYKDGLYRELREIDDLIAYLTDHGDDSGPWEIPLVGRSA